MVEVPEVLNVTYILFEWSVYMYMYSVCCQVLIPTDGGRYDVDLHRRQRKAIYWEEPVSSVRRCSWFFKGEGERWYLPYDEVMADKLEVS